MELILPRMHGSVTDTLAGRSQQPHAANVVQLAFIALFRALMYLHTHFNTCHRDVKPDNLLLRLPPGDPKFSADDIKLADYGYSKCEGVNSDASKYDLPGTLPYTAPEVLQTRIDRNKMLKGMMASAKQACDDAADAENAEKVQQIISAYGLPRTDDRRLLDLDAVGKLKEVADEMTRSNAHPGAAAKLQQLIATMLERFEQMHSSIVDGCAPTHCDAHSAHFHSANSARLHSARLHSAHRHSAHHSLRARCPVRAVLSTYTARR